MIQYLDLEKIAEDSFNDELVKIAGSEAAKVVAKYTTETIKNLRKRVSGMTPPSKSPMGHFATSPEVAKANEEFKKFVVRS